MTYNCTIEKQEDGLYVAQFPDMTNILTCGFSHEEALKMAEEALNGVLAVDLDHGHPIAENGHSFHTSLHHSGFQPAKANPLHDPAQGFI